MNIRTLQRAVGIAVSVALLIGAGVSPLPGQRAATTVTTASTINQPDYRYKTRLNGEFPPKYTMALTPDAGKSSSALCPRGPTCSPRRALTASHSERFTYPGAASIFTASPWQISRRAPLIGEHNGEVFAELGLDGTQLAVLRAAGTI